MTAPVRVRVAHDSDSEAVAILLRDAFAEFVPFYTVAAFAATTPEANELRHRLSEGPIWVAEGGDRIIGTVSALPRPAGVYLRGLAVAPAARGHGVARLLLDAVEAFARECNAARIHLRTTPFLFGAIRLYEAAGFVRTPEPPHDFHGTPLVTMEKLLRRS